MWGSLLSLLLSLISFIKQGIQVAPFKAQNVSNNSQVTDIDNGEIAIPQALAVEAIGVSTSSLINPVLLKSGGASRAHMIKKRSTT